MADASLLCQIAGLDDEARAFAQEGQSRLEFITALARAEQFPAAVRALAHVLPAADAVAWCVSCLDRVGGHDTAALQAAKKWLEEPDDQRRRAAMDAANEVGLGTPSGCAATAVFFSSGSIAPAHAPEVPPVEYAAAKSVAGGLLIASVLREPENAAQKLRSFLDDGFAMAKRLDVWKEEKAAKG